MEKREIMREFNIHPSYDGFFTGEKISQLEWILDVVSKDHYTPDKNDIFKALQMDLKEKKVLLLGMDPYPQEGVATGLAFEVKANSWNDKQVNTSLKNMLKLIYKTYYKELLGIEELRIKINSGEFPILPPNRLFESLSRNGVLFLNTALTTRVGKPGAHIDVWKNFVVDLIKYIDESNKGIIYLLWGSKAEKYRRYIKNGRVITHNHPAICGKLENPNDFLNGKSFEYTKNMINWLG
jgi:uracil-DNA glycosylase